LVSIGQGNRSHNGIWIGFGQPKPPLVSLEMSTAGCPLNRSYASDIFLKFAKAEVEDEHYFYLYRISYMWYAALGFLITFFGGWLLSWIFELLNWDNNRRIYQDADCTLIKHDLFVPPLAKRLQRRQMPLLVVTGTSSEIGGIPAEPRLDEVGWEKNKAVA